MTTLETEQGDSNNSITSNFRYTSNRREANKSREDTTVGELTQTVGDTNNSRGHQECWKHQQQQKRPEQQ
jgi:hypothetical protein